MKIEATEKRQHVLDSAGIKYAVYEEDICFYFSFYSLEDERRAVKVLSSALEL